MTSLAIVTHLGPIYPPTTGATRRIWGLASHLRSNGFQVTILATSERMTQITIQGARIIETPPALPTTSGIRSKLATSIAAKASAVKFVTFYFNPYHVALLAEMAASHDLDLIQLDARPRGRSPELYMGKNCAKVQTNLYEPGS